MTELLITIQVFEDPDHIERILKSVEKCKVFRGCPILIVNNSYEQIARETVNRVVAASSLPEMVLIDRPRWAAVKKTLMTRLPKRERVWLDAVRLGEPGWSAHLGRMIGMILSRAFFPKTEHILHLDADMVFPLDFQFDIGDLPDFSCFPVSGCPDLSRLEWIDFAARSSGAGPIAGSFRYTQELVDSLDAARTDSIFAHYTEFLKQTAVTLPSEIELPPREEFHGGTYILASDRLQEIPYGEWYDNDWTFFKMLRRPRETADFLSSPIFHASRSKKILSKTLLEQEEFGKILHHAALSRSSLDVALNIALDSRRSELAFVKSTLLSSKSALVEKFTEHMTEKMLFHVEQLEGWVLRVDRESLYSAMRRFDESVQAWPDVLASADIGLPLPDFQF